MKELVTISRYAGMREDLVQAGGGNTSIKLDDRRMAIKASGVQLADVTETSGYSVVDYAQLRRQMDDVLCGRAELTANEMLENALLEGRRPSIETFLHAVTGPVTLHVHATAAAVLAARQGGMDTLRALFPDALLVGYATPGLDLAKLYYQTYQSACGGGKRSFPLIFLKNHGMVVSGASADEVIRMTEAVTRRLEQQVGMDDQAYRDAYAIYQAMADHGLGDKIVVKAENATVLEAFKAFGGEMWEYAVCPDCVVFCGKRPWRYENADDKGALESFIARNGEPVLILYNGNIFIRAESVRKAREVESVLAFSAQIALLNRTARLDVLPEREQDFLLGWDAEKYRQAMK